MDWQNEAQGGSHISDCHLITNVTVHEAGEWLLPLSSFPGSVCPKTAHRDLPEELALILEINGPPPLTEAFHLHNSFNSFFFLGWKRLSFFLW